MGGFNKLKVCRHGLMVFNPRDQYVGRSLDLYGEFAEEEIVLLSRVVGEGGVVVDAGACIGTHTVPLAKRVGPSGAVHAFEPQRLLFQTLCANVALNGLANVYTYHAALGAREQTLFAPIVDPRLPANFAGLELRAHPPGEPVRALPLDSLALERLDLLKVDAEGGELEIMEGARATLRRCRPVVYVESDRAPRRPALVWLLRQEGYRLFWHTPLLFNRDNFLGATHNVFGDTASLNLLGLPEGGSLGPGAFQDLPGFCPQEVEP